MNLFLSKSRTLFATAQAWSDAVRYWSPFRRTRSSCSGGRRVLILVRDCPPSSTGGVYRVAALLRALSRAGWETDVIAGPGPTETDETGRELEAGLPAETRVHRWTPAGTEPSTRFSPFVDGDFSAIRQILELAQQNQLSADAIIASGPRFAEFVAAMVLARRMSVPLILDYRDEWCENPLSFVERGPTDRFWERLSLSRADAVVFTTEASRRHYLASFPVLRRHPTHVVPNGWDDPPRFETASIPPYPDHEENARHPISFYGWLGDHWDLQEFGATLLRASREAPLSVNRFQFRFVGRKSPENLALLNSPGLSGLTAEVPHLPFALARSEMRRDAALLLLNNAALARVLPGKLFEYVAARRPVLLYGLGGEMETILRSIPGTRFVARGDARGLVAALEEIQRGLPQSEVDRAPSSLIHGFQRDVQMERFLAMLEDVVRTRNPSLSR